MTTEHYATARRVFWVVDNGPCEYVTEIPCQTT
jgi:hypothetical protein